MTLGKKARELRQRRGWSLAELSKHSGVALSSLSRVETGKMTGTLESHIRISRALGVRLSELYAALDPAGPPVETRRANETGAKRVVARGARWEILAQSAFQKKMLPMILHLEPGKATPEEKCPAGSEKFVYLLKGELEISVGSDQSRADPGDAVYLQAYLTHRFHNTGSSPALALVVTCPPAL